MKKICILLLLSCLSMAGKEKKRNMDTYLKTMCKYHDLKQIDILRVRKDKPDLTAMPEAERESILEKLNLPKSTKVEFLSFQQMHKTMHTACIYFPAESTGKIYLVAYDNDGKIIMTKTMSETQYEPTYKFYCHTKFVNAHTALYTQIFYKGKYQEKGNTVEVDSTCLRYTFHDNGTIKESLILQKHYQKKL